MQDNQKIAKPEKRFTIAEADAMLPLVQSIASDVCSIFRSVTSRRADLHRLLRKGPRTSGQQYDDEMAESRADLQTQYEEIWQLREELETLGVLLRQPEDGAIEFPTYVNGQEAYLCWQVGDDKIRFWRDAQSPHATRQPLPEKHHFISR